MLLGAQRPLRRRLYPRHYDELAAKVEMFNRNADAQCVMVPKGQQREEIDSDFYQGGMLVQRSGKLHPALYYKGLLDAARRYGVRLCVEHDVERITGKRGAFRCGRRAAR